MKSCTTVFRKHQKWIITFSNVKSVEKLNSEWKLWIKIQTEPLFYQNFDKTCNHTPPVCHHNLRPFWFDKTKYFVDLNFSPSDGQRNMNLLGNCNGNPIGSASLPAFLKKEVFQLSELWSPESVLNIHWISLSPSSGPFFGHHTAIDKSHVAYEAGRMIYWCAAWVSIAARSSFLIRSSHTSKLFGNM